jgi:hypothetical protein
MITIFLDINLRKKVRAVVTIQKLHIKINKNNK